MNLPALEDICGAKIRKLLHEQYKGQIMSLKLKLDRQMIDQIISNSRAYTPTISVPHMALMNLMRVQIEQIKDPTSKVIEIVKDLLNECLLKCLADLKEVHYFRLLYKLIKDKTANFISDKHDEASKFSLCLIDIEISHINLLELADEGKMEESGKMLSECMGDISSSIINKSGQVQARIFLNSLTEYQEAPEDYEMLPHNAKAQTPRKEEQRTPGAPPGPPSASPQSAVASSAKPTKIILERNRLCEIVKDQVSLVKIIDMYFARIKQRISEIVAKAIVYHMVQSFREQCGKYLQIELLKVKDIATILKEDPKIAEERRCIEENLARITKGLESIDKIKATFG